MDLDLVNLIDVTPSQVDVYNTAITEERLRSDASEKKNRPGTKRVVQVVLLVCSRGTERQLPRHSLGGGGGRVVVNGFFSNLYIIIYLGNF